MAIKTFKEILNNQGYRISSNDRKIFEEGNLESFFGFGETDAIEFIVYDMEDNQLPQMNDELIRYIPLTTANIKDYFLIAEGTIFKKHQFPSEYFIDIERLLREAGYDNGIYKTQITLLNKRVGSNFENDKLWIAEISPSRTEVRLLPLKRGVETNPELKKRFDLFIDNAEFRDDTINLAFNFIEKLNPIIIDSFLKSKYSTKWLEKMNSEFKISDFDTFSTVVYNKFIEACFYEFTNRVSNITDVNYGKVKKEKPVIELPIVQIESICKQILVRCIDFYLSKPDVKKEATFDAGIDDSIDIVGKVLQRLESNTKVDTTSPVIKKAQIINPILTSKDLKLEEEIKKQIPDPPFDVSLPLPDPPAPIEIVTPIEEPPYVPPIYTKPIDVDYLGTPSNGGGGGGGNTRDFITDYGNGNPWDMTGGKLLAEEYTMNAQK
jgi:hypothetical protein